MSRYRTRNVVDDNVDNIDDGDEDEYSANDEGKNTDYANENDGIDENTEAHLLPCESEKKYILSMFEKLRKDNHFCDVVFQCHGSVFHAHRVIVSSWSRWLRALLCEASSKEDNILTLDFFDATAFGYVLDYMYGIPLMINVDVSA